MTDPRLARLSRIAALFRDARLAELAAAKARLAALDQGIAALTVSATADDPALMQAAARHALWAEERRRALDAARAPLAEAEAEAAERARRALARADLLERLSRRRGGQLS